MSDEIQVGDLVECIDGIPGSGIETGSTYRVLRADHRFLYFNPKNDFSGWFRDRFRKVEPPMITPLAPKPDVHCGGPYVASSVYEQALAEIEDLKRQLADHDMSWARKGPDQDAPLSQPDPPMWLRVGWWYAMDRDGEWWMFPHKPTVSCDTAEWSLDGCGVCAVKIQDTFWLADMNLIASRKTPTDRWQEACWQVKE